MSLRCTDFRKSFDTVLRKNLWDRLEEIKVSSELRVVAIRLYEKFITKFKNTEGWLKEINCNIGVKQGCPCEILQKANTSE